MNKTITIDVPDAHIARQTYEKGLYDKAVLQASQVSGLITAAIKKGSLMITLDKIKLEPGVQAALEAKGYKVTYTSGYDQRDGDSWAHTTVSWDK